MKNSIKGLHLSRLRNEEYFEFHSEIADVVNKYELPDASRALVAVYHEGTAELRAAVDILRASFHTARLNAADSQRTKTYRCLRSAIRGYLRHANLDKRTAAYRIDVIVHHYGDASCLSHDAKTGTIRNLLQDMNTETGHDLHLINLTDWRDELAANNQAYIELKQLRSAEACAKQVPRNMQAVRKSLDNIYRKLVYHLEAHAMLNPADATAGAVMLSLQSVVDSAHQLIAQRRGLAAYWQGVRENRTSMSEVA